MQGSDLRNNAERRLWDAFPRGEMVDLGPGDPTVEDFDPDAWAEDRCVRGEVIVRLLLGAREREVGYVARVALAGARITGEVNLGGGQIEYDLILSRCWMDAAPNFTCASSKVTIFPQVHMPGLLGGGWQVAGVASFTRSRCTGEVRLHGAHIAGQLNFVGATLTNPDGIALNADTLMVDQDMVCNDGFTATGEVRLPGARIGGQLDFVGATLTNPDGIALNAQGLTVDQDMVCRGFTATGEVHLPGAHIGAQLSLTGATLTNPDGIALNAQGLTVDQDMVCRGFAATGEVRLLGAHISGQLNFVDATLTNPDGIALTADRLTVDQDMACEGFTATGDVHLLGAHISGQLSLTGATLTNPDGIALNADRLTVDQGMVCRGGFTATGEVRLPAAHISGQLSFVGATLTNPDDIALNAQGLTVDQGMVCRGGFTATGEVYLNGAHISGPLNFVGATLTNAYGVALDLRAIECRHLLLGSQIDGQVDLNRARLGTLHLPNPDQPPMRLAGLTYTDLDPDPDPPVRQRIAWLRRDPEGFHPQPYEQLASYYRSIGHDRDARRVLLAKHRTRRRALPHSWRIRHLRPMLATIWRIPGWLLDALSGYGYVPWRAFGWLITAVATGTVLLLLRHAAPATTPTRHSTVNALLLALDATVPTAPFGIRDKVTLTGWNYGITLGLQILGYALVLAVLPAISRTLNRTDR